MEYKGQLSGFPEHVVELMLKRQVEQGNERNVAVFENYAWAGKVDGGFNWNATPERNDFWYNIIGLKIFPTLEQLPRQKSNTSR